MIDPRHGGIRNMFCRHDKTQNTPLHPGSIVVVLQGSIMTVVGSIGNQSLIRKMESDTDIPLGFSLQLIVLPYNLSPEMDYNLKPPRVWGTHEIVIGDPCGVYHGPGAIADIDIYETDTAIAANDLLYASANGKLTTAGGTNYAVSGWNHDNPVGIAMNSLSVQQLEQGAFLRFKLLI